jgi:acetyl esterase/lipase
MRSKIPSTISDSAKRAYQDLLEIMQAKEVAFPKVLPGPDDKAAWRDVQDIYLRLVTGAFDTANSGGCSKTAGALGGVAVLDIEPAVLARKDVVLVYVHGGAYVFGSAASALPAAVLIAQTTGYRTISIDYTLAPHAKWQQITAEVVSVLLALQAKGYAPERIAICGDSAGGGLAAGAVLKMRDQGSVMPGAVILWSPWSDISERGDSYETLMDADPMLAFTTDLAPAAAAYAAPVDWLNPYVSPVYGDYSKGFPPTLIQAGTREIFLSNCVRHYQAIESGGVPAKLDLYEGMPHVFQVACSDTPESALAMRKMTHFLHSHIPT